VHWKAFSGTGILQIYSPFHYEFTWKIGTRLRVRFSFPYLHPLFNFGFDFELDDNNQHLRQRVDLSGSLSGSELDILVTMVYASQLEKIRLRVLSEFQTDNLKFWESWNQVFSERPNLVQHTVDQGQYIAEHALFKFYCVSPGHST
jgi:hypothetical protein